MDEKKSTRKKFPIIEVMSRRSKMTDDPILCSFCKKGFSTIIALNNHVKIHHVEEFFSQDPSSWQMFNGIENNKEELIPNEQTDEIPDEDENSVSTCQRTDMFNSDSPMSKKCLKNSQIKIVCSDLRNKAKFRFKKNDKTDVPVKYHEISMTDIDEISITSDESKSINMNNTNLDVNSVKIFGNANFIIIDGTHSITQNQINIKENPREEKLQVFHNTVGLEGHGQYEMDGQDDLDDGTTYIENHAEEAMGLQNELDNRVIYNENRAEKSIDQQNDSNDGIIHYDGEIYMCVDCNECFQTIEDLDSHKKNHEGGKIYEADSHQAIRKSNEHPKKQKFYVKDHKSTICDVCARIFNSCASLEYHYRMHTGEKPNKCAYCQKSFRLIYHLRVHERIHTGEKPFKCPQCQKAFGNQAAYSRHKRVHTGEKPFTCPLCSKSFTQSNSMKLHLGIVHLNYSPAYRKKKKAQTVISDG